MKKRIPWRRNRDEWLGCVRVVEPRHFSPYWKRETYNTDGDPPYLNRYTSKPRKVRYYDSRR